MHLPVWKKPRSAQWLLAGLVFAISFWASSIVARATTYPPLTQTMAIRDFNSWQYHLTREADGLIALKVDLSRRDEFGINDYVHANAEMAKALFSHYPTVEGRVIYSQPIREKDLPVLIQNSSSEILQYELQFESTTGEIGTIFGAPSKTELFPTQMLSALHQELEAKLGPGEIRGITSITLTMDEKRYRQLLASPYVLFVDVTPAFALMDARRSSLINDHAPLLIDYAPMYWHYEQMLHHKHQEER
jgi:hypothetical protein